MIPIRTGGPAGASRAAGLAHPVDVNVKGVANVILHVVPAMIARGSSAPRTTADNSLFPWHVASNKSNSLQAPPEFSHCNSDQLAYNMTLAQFSHSSERSSPSFNGTGSGSCLM